MVNNLCERLGHISSRGTVTLDKNELKVYDVCKRCNRYYTREPTEEEMNRYLPLVK